MTRDEITIRSATPGDEGGIAALFTGLTPDSARLRFSHPLSPGEGDALAVLHTGTTSLVAVHEGEVIGEARYERTAARPCPRGRTAHPSRRRAHRQPRHAAPAAHDEHCDRRSRGGR